MARFHIVEPPRIARTANDPGDDVRMTDEYAEIDLAALSDDELTEQMHNDLYDGMAAEIVEGTNILLGRGWSATRVRRSSCLPRAHRRGPV